jgi:hypothetical protein
MINSSLRSISPQHLSAASLFLIGIGSLVLSPAVSEPVFAAAPSFSGETCSGCARSASSGDENDLTATFRLFDNKGTATWSDDVEVSKMIFTVEEVSSAMNDCGAQIYPNCDDATCFAELRIVMEVLDSVSGGSSNWDDAYLEWCETTYYLETPVNWGFGGTVTPTSGAPTVVFPSTGTYHLADPCFGDGQALHFRPDVSGVGGYRVETEGNDPTLAFSIMCLSCSTSKE